MSSSSLDGALRAFAMTGMAVFPAVLPAQQIHFQPEVTARGEYHTNRNLAIDDELEEAITGYRATAQGLWLYRTGTREVSVRPRVDLQRYPGRRDLQRAEQYLHFRANQRTQRSDFGVRGNFSRRDTYTSELVEAEFDELDPDDAVIDESGRVIGANTRSRLRVLPQYSYRLTERTSAGGRFVFERRRYDIEIGSQQVGFDYLEAGAAMSHDLDPRSQLGFSPYVSRYDTNDGVNRTISVGATGSWNTEWTERLQLGVSGSVEQSDIEIRGSEPFQETTTHFGLALNGQLDGPADRLRFTLARAFHPTSGGNRNITHQVRAQYDRDLSPRLSFRTAARAFRTQPQGSFSGGNDRDYARADISLRWELTRTWFVRGGYNFIWQEYAGDESGAANNSVYLNFGFRGLGPPR